MIFEIYPVRPLGSFGYPNPFAPTEWRWRFRGGNGEIVAHGESYKNKRDCEHAVALLKRSTWITPVRMVRA